MDVCTHTVIIMGGRDRSNAGVGGRSLRLSSFFSSLSLSAVVFSSKCLFNLAGFSRVGHLFLPNLSGNFYGRDLILHSSFSFFIHTVPLCSNFSTKLWTTNQTFFYFLQEILNSCFSNVWCFVIYIPLVNFLSSGDGIICYLYIYLKGHVV